MGCFRITWASLTISFIKKESFKSNLKSGKGVCFPDCWHWGSEIRWKSEQKHISFEICSLTNDQFMQFEREKLCWALTGSFNSYETEQVSWTQGSKCLSSPVKAGAEVRVWSVWRKEKKKVVISILPAEDTTGTIKHHVMTLQLRLCVTGTWCCYCCGLFLLCCSISIQTM